VSYIRNLPSGMQSTTRGRPWEATGMRRFPHASQCSGESFRLSGIIFTLKHSYSTDKCADAAEEDPGGRCRS
jgi:hypothetical protein